MRQAIWTLVGNFADNTNGQNLATTALTSITSDSFNITIDNISQTGAAVGGIDSRDRGDATTPPPLARVAEEFAKNNLGVIRTTLGSLPAGQFTITSYHVDPDNGQADPIEVFVTDAAGTAVLCPDTGTAGVASSTGGVNGLTTARINNSTAIFDVTSNGTDPVILYFDGRNSPDADPEVPLNGLYIQQIPEPGALGVLGLAVAGLLARNRRRTATGA